MPRVSQILEWAQHQISKGRGDMHCNQPLISEELRQAAIENKPDSQGKQRTRIVLETYSPEAYSEWNEMLERLLKRCGYNPIVLTDLILLLVSAAEKRQMTPHEDGIDVALHSLFQVCSTYEDRLRLGKQSRKRK